MKATSQEAAPQAAVVSTYTLCQKISTHQGVECPQRQRPEEQHRAQKACKPKSFVRRQGRITVAQRDTFAHHWQERGHQIAEGLFDPVSVFGRKAPLILEIGFGMGQSLLEMCLAQPEVDFIGVEVHRPGVGRLLREAAAADIRNLRVFQEDALQVLEHCIGDDSLAGVQLFFPDPWPKKRHHKRRIVQAEMVALVHRKLAKNGYFHMATDWAPYAVHMLSVMNKAPGYRNLAENGQYHPRPPHRPLTKFEARGQALGHTIWDLLFVRESLAQEATRIICT